ncbi:MAG: cytochrome c [Opitutaceae bacterium]|nr:cytochrome c [Opitutaceae bacterium]
MNSTLKHFIASTTIAGLIAAGSLFAASASENFENHCAKCHGADGKGQTKVGKKLNVRDMTTAAYKKEFDDAKAIKSLKEGIKKDGKEIKRSFASDLSEAELKELIGYVKALK